MSSLLRNTTEREFYDRVFPRTDPVQEARDRIRAAIRIAHTVEVQQRAHDCTDDWDMPNDGTAITRELALALDALGDVR